MFPKSPPSSGRRASARVPGAISVTTATPPGADATGVVAWTRRCFAAAEGSYRCRAQNETRARHFLLPTSEREPQAMREEL